MPSTIETARAHYDDAVARSLKNQTSDAVADVVATRHALDDAIISAATGADDARARAAGYLSTVTPGIDSPELRSLVEPINPSGQLVRTATIPMTELRTEYPLLAGDGGAGAYGSYAVATKVSDPLVALVNESAVLQANPMVLRTQGGEPLRVPMVESGNIPTATYRTEGEAATETDAILTKADISTMNISGWLEVSQEFLSDSAIGDAHGFVMGLCGKALGMKLGAELASGDGSGAITGVFHDPTTGVTAGKVTPTVDELLALRASVSPANRRGAHWLMSDAAVSHYLTAKDATGQYLLQPDIAGGAFARLWGDPVVVEPYGPALSSGLFPVLYGRMDQGYVVRFAGPLQIEATDAYSYTSWLRTYRFQVRVGAGYLDPLAVKAIELP